MENNKLICMSCNLEITKPAWYEGLLVCSNCCKLIKSSFQALDSKQMRTLGNFLIFWSGLKYNSEQKAERKIKRWEKELQKKWLKK